MKVSAIGYGPRRCQGRIPDGFFPSGLTSGVAVSDRSIYVSDDGVNKVYEFPRNR